MEIILEGLDKYFVVECALASHVQYQSALSFSKSESSAGAAHECVSIPTPNLLAFTQRYFLPRPSRGPCQSTWHIYNQFIVLSHHVCIKYPFLWAGGAGRRKNVNPQSGMRSPSENIASIKNFFPFTMLSPGHGDLTIKITCRHAWGKKDGGTYMAGMAEGEEIGIKTQKAAEQGRASPSLLTPRAPRLHPFLPFSYLCNSDEGFPPQRLRKHIILQSCCLIYRRGNPGPEREQA